MSFMEHIVWVSGMLLSPTYSPKILACNKIV
jgi:hypothetical protein